MTQELPDIGMHIEVMGCPTTCQHCWAVGRPYQAMPLDDIAWILHEVRRFCDAHHLSVDGYPMHEVAAHPQASQVMRLFHDLWNVVENPVPTTGVPMATRNDWREFLETLLSLGTSTLWFAFHGVGEVHDRAVLREGAYRESLRAIALTRQTEMRAGCNLFVDVLYSLFPLNVLAPQETTCQSLSLQPTGLFLQGCEVGGHVYTPWQFLRWANP